MTQPALTPSVTRVGVSPSGLTKEIRAKLTALARRGIAICQRLLGRRDRDPAHDRGTRLLGYLCENLDRAMTELAVADHRIASLERSVAAANLRIEQLKAKLRAETFDEETKERETPAELVIATATRTGVISVPAGVR